MTQINQANLVIEDRKDCHQVMLFDLSVRGHHPGYIRHLIKYWATQELSGHLDIVVTRKFFDEHAEVVALGDAYRKRNIRFITITKAEEAALKPKKSSLSRILRYFQEWQLLCHYALKLKTTHCAILYLDTYFLPLALGAKSPCPFSGIYFRPTFHYAQFSDFASSWQSRWQSWWEKLLLSRILKNPQLKTLFCLDQFVVKHLERFRGVATPVCLPDPVQTYCSSTQLDNLREILEIDSDRQVFLLFGALNQRKGILQLLEAIQELPQNLSQKLCLLLIGESAIASQIETQIAKVCQVQPVQIIRRYEFVPEEKVQTYFQLADVILAPYQRHVGMSGILLLAAAAEKPVLSSNYGLMGEIVRRYRLGLTVDSTKPQEIAEGLSRLLLEPTTQLYSPSLMKTFVEQNSAEEFARTIFTYL